MHVPRNITVNGALYTMNFIKLDSVSDLGIRFSKVSFLEHMNEKNNNAYSILGVIMRNYIYAVVQKMPTPPFI